MAGQYTTRRPLMALTLAALALAQSASGQEPLRLSALTSGNPKPVVLTADAVSSWREGKFRVLKLQGTVLVEQGVVQLRAADAVAWVDPTGAGEGRMQLVSIYAEGDARLEDGSSRQRAAQVVLELGTRGEVRVRAHGGKADPTPTPNDPLVVRGRAMIPIAMPTQTTVPTPPPTPAPLITQAGGFLLPTTTPPVNQSSGTLPAAPETTPPTLPPPGPTRPVVVQPTARPPAPAAPTSSAPGSGPNSGTRRYAPPPAYEPGTVPVSPGRPSAAPVVPPMAPPDKPIDPDPEFQPAPKPVPAPDAGQQRLPAGPGGPPQARPPEGRPPQSGAVPPVPGLPGKPAGSKQRVRKEGEAEPEPPADIRERLPEKPARVVNIAPRTSSPFQIKGFPMPNGEQAIVVTGGIIMNVRGGPEGTIDFEADRLVVFTQGSENSQRAFDEIKTGTTQDRNLEFYMAGNVEVRTTSGPDTRILRCEQAYYDVTRSTAVAVSTDLELRDPRVPVPAHVKADEMLQLNRNQFQLLKAEVAASRLPSDPGLKLSVADGTMDIVRREPRSIFGLPVFDLMTMQFVREEETDRIVRGKNAWLEVEDVPVFYFPWVRTNADDPLGPFQNFAFSNDQAFGTAIYTGWDLFELLGLRAPSGNLLQLQLDYLSERGPAAGTLQRYNNGIPPGQLGSTVGMVKTFGIYDRGQDLLGGDRGDFYVHPDFRGRVSWRHIQELPYDIQFQALFSLLSDKNFLEQYFKQEFDQDINQESLLFFRWSQGQFAASLLAEKNIQRDWVTETQWLPRGDFAILGQSFFDVFTYNMRANAGWAQMVNPQIPPPILLSTDQATYTGRYDVFQDLSIPFQLGPMKLVPYGVVDFTHYSQDLTYEPLTRAYGGGGARASMPVSRLFPEVQSEFFNLNGIYHKAVLGTNFYAVRSDQPFTELPQLDRLNDDATDQAIRDITVAQSWANPTYGNLLATSPLYNPQLYAIRRLNDNRVDTLDTIQALQTDLRQRWQTKRGFPGMQHTVDFITLDVSATYFPDPQYNFEQSWAFLEYLFFWNVGDRTAVYTTGWVDPYENGARYFTVGTSYDRDDRTRFSTGYRQIDIVESKMVFASINYLFSPKYSGRLGANYDFGTEVQTYDMMFTRIGKDLSISGGVNYNWTTSNFGVLFMIVPNAAPGLANRSNGMGGGGGLSSAAGGPGLGFGGR